MALTNLAGISERLRLTTRGNSSLRIHEDTVDSFLKSSPNIFFFLFFLTFSHSTFNWWCLTGKRSLRRKQSPKLKATCLRSMTWSELLPQSACVIWC